MRSPLDSPVEVAFAIYLQTLKLSMYAIKTVTNNHSSSISQRKSVNGALQIASIRSFIPKPN
jgi:hypothetical protein